MSPALAPARVLYVIHLDANRKFGSLEQFIVSLAARSRERGGVLVPVFSGAAAAFLKQQLAVVNASFVESFDLQVWSWTLAWRLLALVDDYGANVVDFTFYGPLNRYVTWLRLMRPRVRLVYTDHRSRLPQSPLPTGWRRSWRRLALLQYHTIFAISDFNCSELAKEGWPHLARCQLFIDTTRFRADATMRAKVRADLGAGNEFVAILVAYLISWKGVNVALHAMALASSTAKVWIVGTGPELEPLKRLASDLGLGLRAVFVGEKEDVSPYLQGADCLICPSLWQEAMGFVNLEAMACGLPVIASRTGGIPEFVIHDETGLLVEPGDEKQTAQVLRRLIESPQIREKMGQNAAARVRAKYSGEACLEQYLKNYDRVIGLDLG